jgi:hypothetical protein
VRCDLERNFTNPHLEEDRSCSVCEDRGAALVQGESVKTKTVLPAVSDWGIVHVNLTLNLKRRAELELVSGFSEIVSRQATCGSIPKYAWRGASTDACVGRPLFPRSPGMSSPSWTERICSSSGFGLFEFI